MNRTRTRIITTTTTTTTTTTITSTMLTPLYVPPPFSSSSAFDTHNRTIDHILDEIINHVLSPGLTYTHKPDDPNAAEYEASRIYVCIGMLLLIIHIITVNTLAILTLAYAIVNRRRFDTLRYMLEAASTSRHYYFLPKAIRRRLYAKRKASKYLSGAPLKMNYRTYPYLLSMATGDLMMGSIVVPLQLYLYGNDGIWNFGPRVCDFWRAIDIFFCTSSALHTAAIAADRWWTVTREQRGVAPFPASDFQKMLLGFLWLLSAMVSLPVNYLWQIESVTFANEHPDFQTCEPISDPTFIVMSTTVSFFIPLVLTIGFYVQTITFFQAQWRDLKRKMTLNLTAILTSLVIDPTKQASPAVKPLTTPSPVRRHFSLKPMASAEDGENAFQSTVSEIIANLPENKMGQKAEKDVIGAVKHLSSIKQSRNLIKAMTYVVIMYVVCWTPLFATMLVNAVCQCFRHQTYHTMINVFTWLGYTNSAINPLIYYASLEDYRILSRQLVADIISKRAFTDCFHRLRNCTCWPDEENFDDDLDEEDDFADDEDEPASSKYDKDLRRQVNKAMGAESPSSSNSKPKRGHRQRRHNNNNNNNNRRNNNGNNNKQQSDQAGSNKQKADEIIEKDDNNSRLEPVNNRSDHQANNKEQEKAAEAGGTSSSLVMYYDEWSRPINSASAECTI